MERMNGEIRDREKVVRGVKKENSPLLTGLQIYHNYVRPDMGLKGNRSWVNIAAGLIIAVLGAYAYPTNNLFGIVIMLAGIAILGDALGVFG